MNKQAVYDLLEQKMLTYTDYQAIPANKGVEPLVPVPTTANLASRQIDRNMVPYTGERVYVRQEVASRLLQASRFVATQQPDMQLEVVYGHRALQIQKQLFEIHKRRLSSTYTGQELLAATHRLVAVPEVAGHPAGAAVDIQIIQNGKPLDFGTTVHEFVPDTFTFSPFISRTAWNNRQLLRNAMVSAGFAPFDGEWWHFSYGDKEWARYYNQPAALYCQLDFKEGDMHLC